MTRAYKYAELWHRGFRFKTLNIWIQDLVILKMNVRMNTKNGCTGLKYTTVGCFSVLDYYVNK